MSISVGCWDKRRVGRDSANIADGGSSPHWLDVVLSFYFFYLQTSLVVHLWFSVLSFFLEVVIVNILRKFEREKGEEICRFGNPFQMKKSWRWVESIKAESRPGQIWHFWQPLQTLCSKIVMSCRNRSQNWGVKPQSPKRVQMSALQGGSCWREFRCWPLLQLRKSLMCLAVGASRAQTIGNSLSSPPNELHVRCQVCHMVFELIGFSCCYELGWS